MAKGLSPIKLQPNPNQQSSLQLVSLTLFFPILIELEATMKKIPLNWAIYCAYCKHACCCYKDIPPWG